MVTLPELAYHWPCINRCLDALMKKAMVREFPGGIVVRTQPFHCCGPGSIPGQGTEIPQAMQCSQNKIK